MMSNPETRAVVDDGALERELECIVHDLNQQDVWPAIIAAVRAATPEIAALREELKGMEARALRAELRGKTPETFCCERCFNAANARLVVLEAPDA